MQRSQLDLAYLLSPLSVPEFFGSYWECEPLVIHRADERFYGELLTNRDLEDIISSSDLRYPAIRLAMNGSYYPPQAYTTDITLGRLTFNGVPDVNKISLEYARGATVSLPSLHRTWAPLSSLCARLEEELDFAVHANVYITPGATAGFPAHYDTHEVLVLQIAGKKKWLIDEPPLKLPHNSQGFKSAGYIPGVKVLETELVAGDALYLPRGYVHSTTTSESHSAHVTMGINVLTWADVVRGAVPSCVDDAEYRRGLPPGFASRPELRPALQRQLAKLLTNGTVNHELLIERAIALVQSGRRRMPPRFRADVSVISPSSLLESPRRQQYHAAQADDRLMLDFDGKKVVFSGVMGGVFEAMVARTTFRVADLADGANTEGLLTFARALQSIGFLQVKHV